MISFKKYTDIIGDIADLGEGGNICDISIDKLRSPTMKKLHKASCPGKEKDTGIRRAAKRAGLSRSARDRLYNSVEEKQMSTPQKVGQMQHYWDDLSHMATDDQKKKKMEMKFGIKNIKLDPRKGKILSFEEDRDYKDEYKKFQSSEKMKKYRAELNRYNHEKGTYGNKDGKDASHKKGKIVGFEDENANRGRAEKSRLVGSKRN